MQSMKWFNEDDEIDEKEKDSFKEISEQIEAEFHEKLSARKAENTLQLIHQAI